ncbi:hypothetical protein CPB86DRAFT_790690 [Serendipita vermifera]|nr:hypothetical protein CPB86DRAFT_790690 [Serendipita vermifera]
MPKNSSKPQLITADPIASIPDEILSLVFQHYVEMGLSVWDLIPVSRRWERVAFSTRSLWSSISIRNHYLEADLIELVYHNETEYYDRLEESWHVCLEQSHFSKAMARAGECLLSIELLFNITSQEELLLLESAMDMLMNPKNSVRIKFLKLSIDTATVAQMRPHYFRDTPLQNLHRLQILKLPQEWLQNLLQSICASTRALKVIECSFEDDPLEDLINCLSDRVVNQLQYIEVPSDTSPEQLDALIPRFTNVEEIHHLPGDWPTNATPLGKLNHLRVAYLSCVLPNFRRLQWPSLEELIIYEQDHSAAEEDFRMVDFGDTEGKLKHLLFPELISFTILSYRPLHWLFNITAPRLSELSINWEYPCDTGVPRDLNLCALTTVQDLSLNIRDNETIVWLLASTPNVTSLVITPTEDERFGIAFLTSLRAAQDGFPLCPKLRHLRLGRNWLMVRTPKAMLEPEIRRTLITRAPLDCDFYIDVFWNVENRLQSYHPSRKI